MANTPRTKEYLMRALKNWLAFRKAEDFNLSEDFKFEYRGEGRNYVLVSIKDPSEALPRWYEVRVTEKF